MNVRLWFRRVALTLSVLVVTVVPWGYTSPCAYALGNDSETRVVVKTEQELRDAVGKVAPSDVIVLGDDITLTKGALVASRGSTLVLDLSGHELSRNLSGFVRDGRVIQVQKGASLTILDRSPFSDGAITGGKCAGDGGAISNSGELIVRGGTLYDNRCTGSGGAVYNSGTASFEGTWFEDNNAGINGGAICSQGTSTLSIKGGGMQGNVAIQDGGAIHNAAGSVSIADGCAIIENEAQNGGGIFDARRSLDKGSTFVAVNLELGDNHASKRGGGIYADCLDGSAKSQMPPLTLDLKTTVTNNDAGSEGGGIFVSSEAAVLLMRATVKGNEGSRGGGIYVAPDGILQVKDRPVIGENTVVTDDKKLIAQDVVLDGDPIEVVGKLAKGARVNVDFSGLYKRVTKDYAKYNDMGSEDNKNVQDPSEFFFGHADQKAILKNNEVRIATKIPYVDERGKEQVALDYEEVTDSFGGSGGQAGWFYVDQDVQIAERPSFDVNAHLIVRDGKTLTCNKGIDVPRSGSLAIYGQSGQSGTIIADAKGEDSSSGIGSHQWADMGKLTINGAKVYAYGGQNGSGIGTAGNRWNAVKDEINHSSGPFTLNNGYVEAYGGNSGAGVGQNIANFRWNSGYLAYSPYSSTFNISVKGGTLIARGGDGGPGIGVTTLSAAFTLTVDGGEVVATGGNQGAGIGSVGSEFVFDCAVDFRDGKVVATGGNGMPGVGYGGYNGSSYYPGRNKVTFSGAVVEMIEGSDATKPIAGEFDIAESCDNMVFAGSSEHEVTKVKGTERWETMEDAANAYICVERCGHADYALESGNGSVLNAKCEWCACKSLGLGYACHYEPGEATGSIKDDFVPIAKDGGENWLLPTKPAFVVPAGKELVGWEVDGKVYAPGTKIAISKSSTATALWDATWASVQAWLNDSEAGNEIEIDEDLVATSDDTALTVPKGRQATLDLHGHAIDRALAEPTHKGYVIKVEGSLILKGGGTVTGGNNSSSGADGGGGINVPAGASLTLRGSTVSGNKAACGAGVYTQGTFLLYSGEITGNATVEDHSDGSGGGVMVDGGTFTLGSLGSIENNKATADGGGVMLRSGTFELSGGNIRNNSAGDAGGGVYVGSQGAVNLREVPFVTDNTADDQTSNILLQNPKASPLRADGLGNGAKIGVMTLQEPAMGKPVVFTAGMGGKDVTKYFTSDDPAYLVDQNADGEAILGLSVTVTFDTGGVEANGKMEPDTLVSGARYEIPSCRFRAKGGQDFTGWGLADRIVQPRTVVTLKSDVTLTAQWTDTYALWIGDKQVTDANKDDVLGDGTVTYDPATHTLMLNGFQGIEPSSRDTVIYSSGIDLVISGSGRIGWKQGTSYEAVEVDDGSLTMSGDFVIEGQTYVVRVDGDVLVGSGTISITGTDSVGYGIYAAGHDIHVANDVTSLEVSTKRRALWAGNNRPRATMDDHIYVKEGELTGPYVLIAHRDEIPATATVTPRKGLVYNGEEQELVDARVDGGTILYALAQDGPFLETALGRDAGSYEVYFKVMGDEGYSNLDVAGPVNVAIAKATPSLAVKADPPITHSLDPASVSLVQEGGPEGALVLDVDQLQCGTHSYEWSFVPEDGTNYEPVKGTVEVTSDEHDWGEWTVTKEASETEKGEERRVCKSDSSHVEIREIPETDHVHQLVRVEAQKADCYEPGTTSYWICSEGENPCGRLFADEKGEVELHEDDVRVPILGHDWGEPTYGWSKDYATATAQRVCKRDKSHEEAETVSTTYEDVDDPASAEGVMRIFSAIFANPAFLPQTATVSVTSTDESEEPATELNDADAAVVLTDEPEEPVVEQIDLDAAGSSHYF